MKNKPIIIDGVDVSGCLFRGTNRIGNDIGTYCRLFTGSCKKENCYYKQLQRKTQECEKLRKINQAWGLNVTNLREELETLQQTYKACEKEYKALNEKYIKVLELSKKGVDSYEYCIRDLEEENQKLKAKIKEISEKLDDALDPEETEAEESMDLLWEISEDLENLTTSFNVDKKGG